MTYRIIAAVMTVILAGQVQAAGCGGRSMRDAVNELEYSAWFCAYSLERFGTVVVPTACATTLRDAHRVTTLRKVCVSFKDEPTTDEQRLAREAISYLLREMERTGAVLPQ